MRYAYIKNGDAVAQVRRVLGAASHTGPDANIGGFLAARRSDDVLVLCRSRPAERWASGRVLAESLPGPKSPGGLAGRLVAALRVTRRMMRWRPDRILCGCGREMMWAAVAAARFMRIPVVVARHTGMPVPGGLHRLSYSIEAFFLRLCDGVVCHGPFLADSVRRAGVDPSRIRQFDVDLTPFAADASTGGVPDGLAAFAARFPILVMYVGRMQRDKGILDLLEACSSLGDTRGRRVGLVYVGDGEHLGVLRERVAAAGMDDRVLVMGRVPHASLPAIMRTASVIVTPTRPPLQEGRCMVVLEAFVVGVPVIAPAFAAFPYSVVEGESGLLFGPGDVHALTHCIRRVADDGALLAHLRRGAATSGRRFLDERPPDFAAAVEAAFQ